MSLFHIELIRLALAVISALAMSTPSLADSGSDAAVRPSEVQLTGTNLSGAEFGPIDGKYGTKYIYPSESDLDFVTTAGMNVVRLPVKWERLQPVLYGELDSLEFGRLKRLTTQATNRHVVVIINVHNYARYRGKLIGSTEVPISAFEDLWSKLAQQFAANSLVALGLMNEPHGIDSSAWVASANVAIAAIRRTGARNLILAPGVAWTGAHSWNSSSYGKPNSIAMLELFDPIRNTTIEVHQYLDRDSSGTSSECVNENVGRDRLIGFTHWARQHGKRAFLGEFGAADNTTCEAAISTMLAYVAANSDVWIGWSWWSAGPWWGKYPFSIQPSSDGVSKPQLSWLTPFLAQTSKR